MKRIPTILICAALLAGCASAPKTDQATELAAAGAAYSSAPGTNPVGVIPAGAGLIRDARRNKDVPLAIEYPTKPGPHPVIIFSHNYGGMSRGYVTLGSQWASHGFVVIRPAHADAGTVKDSATSKDPRETWGQQSVADYKNRAEDLKLILDSFATIETQYPELKGKLDATRVGVAGHGYGAFSALLVAGMKAYDGAVSYNYADPRVKAVIAMSPQGISEKRGIRADSWTDVRVPVLYLTGSADLGIEENENAAWRKQAFENSPEGDKWFVSIEGATHFTFSGRPFDPSLVPRFRDEPVIMRRDGTIVQQQPGYNRQSAYIDSDARYLGRVQAIALAFWDVYLRNEPKGREFLEKLAERGGAEVARK